MIQSTTTSATCVPPSASIEPIQFAPSRCIPTPAIAINPNALTHSESQRVWICHHIAPAAIAVITGHIMSPMSATHISGATKVGVSTDPASVINNTAANAPSAWNTKRIPLFIQLSWSAKSPVIIWHHVTTGSRCAPLNAIQATARVAAPISVPMPLPPIPITTQESINAPPSSAIFPFQSISMYFIPLC